jgi:hypothetical protein
VFVPGKLFQPSLYFVGKARSYPIEEPFWSSYLGQALGLAQYHYYTLDLLARKKSLLRKFVNYNRKKFKTLAPGVDLIKLLGRKFTYSIL